MNYGILDKHMFYQATTTPNPIVKTSYSTALSM